MAQNTQETRRELAKRELLALDRAQGYLLRCESGEVWITLDGGAGDIVLAAGQSWRVEGNGQLVVSALCAARLVIAHPQVAPPRIASPRMAEAILLLLQRWKHPSLADWPATLLR